MRSFVYSLVVLGFLSFPAHAADSIMRKPVAGEPAANSPSAMAIPASSAPIPVSDEVMKAFYHDLQSARADIMAKNLRLTADQAAKFWPAYAKYQEEQKVITAPQLDAVKNYVNAYTNGSMDDATAMSLVDGSLTRDLEMNKLRRKWLAEFQKFLPARTAARVIQIDRRLGLAGQMEIAARIPLI